ncbi:MAG: hypothetical protein ACRYFX_00680 [Janthinobacterium lividum]
MFENDILGQFGLLPEVGEFTTLLAQQGVTAALAYLNRRTPHRYTGLFRFDGDVLRTQVQFDCNLPAQQQEQEEERLATAYCALVGRQQAGLDGIEAPTDPAATEPLTSSIFYHSVLIHDAQGRPYGTLCHYDLQRCQQRTTDQPLLEAAALLLYAHCSG